MFSSYKAVTGKGNHYMNGKQHNAWTGLLLAVKRKMTKISPTIEENSMNVIEIGDIIFGKRSGVKSDVLPVKYTDTEERNIAHSERNIHLCYSTGASLHFERVVLDFNLMNSLPLTATSLKMISDILGKRKLRHHCLRLDLND
ncbi:hypothetical protein LOAG_04609 [Loa loa]|uniref:Uncharacterized protein n=1 Tax=Loa loa TaxID=7209 RepID=A0A1S0U1H2_LOALO|nr:hypothetical protein LOAG_04609 [Loa loa]EFO23873.1 hypothetical protein LOAG_04609 [Loa loa]